MADLEEITETPRTDTDDDPRQAEDRRNSEKQRRSGKRRTSRGSQSPARPSLSDRVFEERRKEDGREGQNVQQQADSTKQDVIPIQEDHRARFYGGYRKVAEEYDKEFLKKHDEDLNTTLIFAGLFSAVTSAFIIQFDSQLQPDPNGETAALLRVLIYKFDNTTFGNDIPTLPQWTGPPRTIVQVQAILFATLVISLFSAFLAMLGKQWLNRYESVDMRGSAIERNHNRQRKLGGIVAWYFDHVLESLPLMLQIALLLLGCALCRYLWEIDNTIASVVLGMTSFGVVFYLFIVIAGTAFESCPYQTPAAHLFRHVTHYLRHRLPPTLRSGSAIISVVLFSNSSRLFQASRFCGWFSNWWLIMKRPWYSATNIGYSLILPGFLIVALVLDAYYLGRATLQSVVNSIKAVCRQVMRRYRKAHHRFIHVSPLRTLNLGQRTIMLDLQCISWILQTSLDKAVHLLAFQHLTTIPELARVHPPLVVDCFNIFTGCINISNGKVVIIQGLEQLATASAHGFLRTLHHLATIDPTSSVLAHLQRRYSEILPSDVDFTGLPFHSTMAKIHTLAGRFGNPRDIQWHNYRMSIEEHIPFARRMVEAAQEKYHQTQRRKVPRWILRSVLYLLSLGPLSPASVVADCLTIIAIDLGCDIPTIAVEDESARVQNVSNVITEQLATMVEANNSDVVISKRKAINTLFPYAIFLEQGGQHGMINQILRVARVSDSELPNLGKFMWHHVELYISRLFEKRSPTSLNRIIALISPYVPWEGTLNNTAAVSRWAAAASTITYTEEVGQNVIDALLQIASINFLRAHIPIEIWRWLKRRPPLPIVFRGLYAPRYRSTVVRVRRLGDLDILKSYLLLVWTDQRVFSVIDEMRSAIKDFGGVGMERHREELIERLDQVIEQLDRRQRSPLEREARAQYAKLRRALLEVHSQ